MKGVHRCYIGRAQADVHTAILGYSPHRLALVDPELGILLAETDRGALPFLELGKAERCKCGGVEPFAFGKIAYRDGDVVDHERPLLGAHLF